ncbi:MAG: sll1863 family stress response protein, partial [Thermoguttaceae bacterium]
MIVVVVLVVGVAALAFYRGWFRLSADATDQESSATFTLDQDKFKADGDKAREGVQEFGDKTKEAVGGNTEKVASEDVRRDGDQPVGTSSAATESMQTKEEFQKKLDARLIELDADIARLRKKGRHLKDEAKTNWDQKMAELETKQDAARVKLAEVNHASAEAWKDIRQGA